MNRYRLIIPAIALWVFTSSFSSVVPYQWKDQQMNFLLPDHFIEEKHNDVEFLARGNDMSFQMEVYMDELLSENDLNEFVSRIGKTRFNLTQSEGEGDLQGQGYKGHFTYGLVEGKVVFVVGLLDLDLGLGYVGEIVFDDADKADLSIAQGILKSFARK